MSDDLEALRVEARVIADGTLAQWMLAELFIMSGRPAAMAAEWRKLAESLTERMTVPELSAAESDFQVQEVRDLMVRRIDQATALATRAPYDPASYRRTTP